MNDPKFETKFDPIIEMLAPSPEQRPAISARGCDVVVTAGAGTGKTRTLVARYLALLNEGLPLRSIVAITFTRKAAREMRNRLRETMRDYLEKSDLPLEERQRWQEYYAELDAARVSTIHSLCTEILRAHPAEVGLDPRFEVADENQAQLLMNRAVRESLAWAADETGLIPLFDLFGAGGLDTILSNMLAQRLEAKSALTLASTDLLDQWEQILAQHRQTAFQALVGSRTWQEAVHDLRGQPPGDPTDKLAQQCRDVLAALDENTIEALAVLDQVRLNVGSAKNWPDGREQVSQVKDILRTLREQWRGSQDLLILAITGLDQILAEAIPRLGQLFAYVEDRYTAFKRERNLLDFDDLEDRTLALLAESEGVRQRWQRTVRALLVDEFQDTNARQRDLLGYLNGDQGKLFIVGDAKQSIYRFRGADVSVFRQERVKIEQNGGQGIALATSYRAHQALLAGMNALLAPVLGRTEDPARPWLEPFAPLKPDRVHPGAGFEEPHLELHLTVGSRSTGAMDRAADVLVSRLASLVEDGGIEAGVGDMAKSLRYEDVVILCRASTSFGAYENALEKAGVPFLTVAGRGFYQRPEIRDLLNALQAIADPGDDLALAGLLRSPVLGLSDETLYRLRHMENRDDGTFAPDWSLWTMLKTTSDALSADERGRAERAVILIETLHDQVGRVPVGDLLKQFLDQTDYQAALIQSGQKRSARNVAKFLTDANATNLVSLGEFLAYVETLRESGAREGEARATAEGAVQLMTIHAAKGLEFPVVVLGDLGYAGSFRDRVLLDPELGLLLPLKDENGTTASAYTLGKIQAQDQETAEEKRLLYVAITRAKEKVLLSGQMTLTKAGKPSLRGWLANLARAEILDLGSASFTVDEEGGAVHDFTLAVDEIPVSCKVYEPNYDVASKPGDRPLAGPPEASEPVQIPPPYLTSLTSPSQEIVSERPGRVWRVTPAVDDPKAPAWVVGNLVHKALAAWRFPRVGVDFVDWLMALAKNYGLIDARRIWDAVDRSQDILKRFQRHGLYQAMDGAAQRWHEVPYTLSQNGKITQGSIDALFLDDDRWTIVEFKTDRIRDEAERQALLDRLDYAQQVTRYHDVVEQMLGQTPKVLLCWLNFANQVDVMEMK